MNITIDGIEYYQPECRCTGLGHTCYLRPTPYQVQGIDMAKLFCTAAMSDLESPSSPSKDTL